MGKMHGLLAVEANLVSTAVSLMNEASITFKSKPDRFEGSVRTVKYFDEDRSQENLSERKEIVTTVDEKLEFVVDPIVKMYDALLQKEKGNQKAVADLVVNGITLGKEVPATFLLGMETRLKALREVLLTVPTLDPSIAWVEDKTLPIGVYKSPVLQNIKTEKRASVLTLAQATDKHPAQAKEVIEDRNVARIETTKFSGMWSTKKKADVLGRLDDLLIGVKKARMDANNEEAPSVHIAQNLLDFILKGA